MAHVDIVLRPPSYGWRDGEGRLVVPTTRQVLREFAARLDVFRSRKQWLPLTSWVDLLIMAPFLVAFFTLYFSWPLLLAGFLYSMVLMGSHGTVWYHRYATHRSFEFSHPFWRFVTRNLVIKMVAEELYVVSHLVHHSKSDQPGDPYNPQAGALYCFLADAIHQPIAHDLTRPQYEKACGYVAHTGMYTNTFEQYQTWGSIAHPARLWAHQLANWGFWYAVFYGVGGHALATALFGSAAVWATGVRTFNYGAHGSGQDRRREGEDFDTADRSINQLWPGLVAGEWHNNHHLFANSARSGFKPWQLDLPYLYIRLLHAIGGVSTYRDSREQFYQRHYLPYLAARAEARARGER